jgi:sugar lactone lactonase YvrE
MSADVTPELALAAGCELGEGPVWRAAEAALWFVDIKQKQIHRWTPGVGEHRVWAAPDQCGFVVPVEGGGWIAGLKSGLHRFDPASGAFTPMLAVEDPALGNRLNDAFVDAQGRLWFGSMHDPEETPSGAFYRLDARGAARMDMGYVVTNGPAVSPDGRTLYHVDTLEGRIDAYDLAADGALGGRRAFTQIEAGAGFPDGPAVDAEGCVWIGLFGGWAARRYSPRGELLQTVRFPVANVTKIAFGGPDLATAYATTAWMGLSPGERARQPLAGGVFSFPLPAPGLPQHEVRATP